MDSKGLTELREKIRGLFYPRITGTSSYGGTYESQVEESADQILSLFREYQSKLFEEIEEEADTSGCHHTFKGKSVEYCILLKVEDWQSLKEHWGGKK